LWECPIKHFKIRAWRSNRPTRILLPAPCTTYRHSFSHMASQVGALSGRALAKRHRRSTSSPTGRRPPTAGVYKSVMHQSEYYTRQLSLYTSHYFILTLASFLALVQLIIPAFWSLLLPTPKTHLYVSLQRAISRTYQVLTSRHSIFSSKPTSSVYGLQ